MALNSLYCADVPLSNYSLTDLNPVDYQIWRKLQERVYRSRNHDVDQLKLRLIEDCQDWEHFRQVFIDEAIRQ